MSPPDYVQMKHQNKQFDRKIKPELIKAGFTLNKTKNGYKITKENAIYFIHPSGGSKCFKRLKRILRNTFNYNLMARTC